MARRRWVILATTATLPLASCTDDAVSVGLPATTAPVAETRATTAATPTTTPSTDSVPDLGAIRLRLTTVATLDSPIAIVTRAGTRDLYVAEREGTVVRLIENGDRLDVAGTVIDLTDEVGSLDGERGLLGLAFSPDGSNLYVNYTDSGDDGSSVIASFPMTGDTADIDGRREILRVKQPYPNHNGGNLTFGPDGYLWIGFGDGGSQDDPHGNGQNPAALLGKMLRLDVANPPEGAPYAVPADNPFVGEDDKRTEIWMTGLRNPWRYAFDRLTGDLWVADVGGSEWEEIDLLPAADGTGRGANLGWQIREGSHDTGTEGHAADLVDPIFEYSHDEGSSITGGYVYRGSAIPDLRGVYLFSDFTVPTLRGLTVRNGALHQEAVLSTSGAELSQVVSFGEDSEGELYVVCLSGDIVRIEGTTAPNG